MQCSDIHDDGGGCAQAVPGGASWKFCPHCGRLLGHAQADESPLTPLPDIAQRAFLRLRCAGIAPVSASIAFEAEISGTHVVGSLHRTLRPRQADTLELDLPPLANDATLLGYLTLQAEDGEAEASDDPWQPRPWVRTKLIPLRVRVARPAQLSAAQDIALFSEQTPERTIDLMNGGDQPITITEIRLPQGYILKGPQPARVSALGSTQIKLRRDWSVDAPQDVLLEIPTGSGKTATVHLRSAPRQDTRELPAAIIGVDFGTAYTSVAFRECRYNPDLPDEVKFLRPPGQDTDRFPTRLWLGKDKSARFGLQAKAEFEKDETAGYLFREIKTLLRQIDNDLIHPRRFQGSAYEYMVETYGKCWPEALVTRYLAWLRERLILPKLLDCFGSTDVHVRYVFSLPVLDFATDGNIYKTQFENTRRCVAAAGFPVHENQVDFQFEPVCAALGLLYSTNEEEIPRLGSRAYPIKDGDHIAVFDSGGGTTDIVLARVEATGDQGGIALHVEHCLGVGTEVETFGGEWVTDALDDALRTPANVPGDRAWYSGPLSRADALDSPEDELARDEVEMIKRSLADDDLWEHTNPQGDEVKIRSSVLARLIKPHLQSLSSEMRERVFKEVGREETRYYLCVGGNTALKDVEAWVQAFMQDDDPKRSGRQLCLPEASRQMAVAYGAAWVPDARIRNAVPYDMTLLADDKPLLTLARNTSQDVLGLSRLFQIGPHQTLEFHLQTLLNTAPCRIATAAFTNYEDDTVRLNTYIDVQNGTLTLKCSIRDGVSTSDQRELMTYRL